MTAGTLPTHTPLFVVLLVGVVLMVGALTFVPALALGPVVEHLQMIAKRLNHERQPRCAPRARMNFLTRPDRLGARFATRSRSSIRACSCATR